MIMVMQNITYVGGLPQCLDCSEVNSYNCIDEYGDFNMEDVPEGTTLYYISSSIDDTWTRPLFCSKKHAKEYLSALTISEHLVI
tara:strand:- start:1127 stop:1378 length:252 start_codon:yes stop_codon:yes gene_type:complete